MKQESKYHYARELIYELRVNRAINEKVYLHYLDKINPEDIKALESDYAELEEKVKEYHGVIYQAMLIKDLWLPDVVGIEHEEEAKALHSMKDSFLEALKTITGDNDEV